MFLKIFVIKVGPSCFKKVYAKVNASPVIFGKIPSFVWRWKLKINEF